MIYKVGQKVRLVKDEGLDTPEEYQGQEGIVLASYPDDPARPNGIMVLDLQMGDGMIINNVTEYQVVGA